jgi:hypothetical protein
VGCEYEMKEADGSGKVKIVMKKVVITNSTSINETCA